MSSTEQLLERADELSELVGLLARAVDRAGSLLVVEGRAGVGKTSLLRAASAAADEAGCMRLHATGGELERELPFGVVRQLFEPALANTTAARRRSLLRGPARLAAPILDVQAQMDPTVITDASFAALHGLYWFATNLSEHQPLVLVVDDVHWSDLPSLRWLNYLALRLEGLAVAVLLATRPIERLENGQLVGNLASVAGVRTVRLHALSKDAVVKLVRATFRDASNEFASACHHATAGNPFYLSELLRALSADGIAPGAASAADVSGYSTESVRHSLLVRLARLPAAAAQLTRAVAVLGPDADLRRAGHLAGIAQAEATAAVDALTDIEVLVYGRPLRFVHPIVRTTIYDDLPAGARTALHRRAAELLSDEGAPPEQLAPHLLACEPAGDQWVVETLRAASREVITRGAPDTAVGYLRRALAEPPSAAGRTEVLRELGSAEFLCRDPTAEAHLAAAIAAADSPVDGALATRALAMAWVVMDRPVEAVAILDRALRELGDEDGQLSTLLLAQMLAAGVIHSTTRPAHREHMAALAKQELGETPPERLLLANLTCWASIEGKPRPLVRKLASRALSDGELLTEVGSESQFYYLVTNGLFFAECFEFAEQLLAEALEDGQRRGSRGGVALASAWRAFSRYRRGALDDAAADAITALQVAGEAGYERIATSIVAETYVEQGSLGEAQAAIERSDMDLDHNDGLLANGVRHARGALRLARGEFRAALDDMNAVGTWLERWASADCACWPWRSSAALALSRLGEPDRAEALATDDVKAAGKQDRPRALGVALRTAGLVNVGSQRMELLEEATRVLASSDARLEHARALVDLGAALRRSNHRSDARSRLQEGVEIATQCGARALVERAIIELRATGARPRRLVYSGLDSLTATERRVAQLAASGQSNRDIAESLFVTVKTVETHLAHTYLKLDVSGRAELAPVLQPSS